MQSKLTIVVLMGFILMGAAACGGGGGSDDPPRMTSMEPDTPMTYEVELPAGHGLTAGTVDVPSEGIELETGTTISCASEDGCQLTVTAAPVTGQLSASSTGGEVTVAVRAIPDDPEPTPEPEPVPEPVEEEEEAEEEETEEEEPVSALEAHQRAENLLAEFQGSDGTALTSPAVGTDTSPVTITVPTRNNLTFKEGTRTVGRISQPGLRGARLTRSRGGTSTTVVYTDRELSRELLDHYGTARNADDMTVFDLDAAPLDLPDSILQTSDLWSISHGVATSVAAVDGDSSDNNNADPATTLKDDLPTDAENALTARNSYPGKLHGLNGDFVCIGDGCQVQVTPDYADTVGDNGQFALESVAVVATGDGATLHFKPDRGVVLQLYVEGPVGSDAEYMSFGYWRDEPASTLGDYAFGVFADRVGGAPTSGLTGTAEYDGTAVGMYVEQGALGTSGVTTKQGEFTADVRLDVNFDGTDTAGIDGTIDGFKATPTGDSTTPTTIDTWVVKLTNSGTVASTAMDGTARIDIRGTTSTGAWTHAFVRNSEYAAAGQPPAVTGTFNTRIPDLLHIVGAFGAHKQ